MASPALLGGDVSHLNLHKTFCIPHGGGGPGRRAGRRQGAPRPVPARPGQPAPDGGSRRAARSRAASYGSAGVLPISWAYIAMMGAAGLRRATQVAVLSANYVARRLAPYFPVVYAGRDGLVAHECIVDLRRLPGGITVEDVAKRLIDYGFHAPTMSFPVAGTFMIEPTESESLAELDAFCDALIAVRAEVDKVAIRRVGRGRQPAEERAAHRRDADRGRSGTTPTGATRAATRAASAPRGLAQRPGQVLAAGPPHRPGLRRPEPGLRLPAARGVRVAR